MPKALFGKDLQVLLEEAAMKNTAEWAKEAGIEASVIEELAHEFTSHGKKAVCDIHRGVSQHTSGYYNVLAWNTLNLLIGNLDHRGGFIKLSTFNTKVTRQARPITCPGTRGNFPGSA